MKRTSLRRPALVTSRHGVVLLVMLSLLALFTVIAVTFVVASGQFRRSAAASSRDEQYGDPFDVLLQQALLQIVRGTNNPHSVIGPHSLLEDMYGHGDAVVGRIESRDEFQDPSQEMSRWENAGYSRMLLKLGAGVSYGWDKKPGFAGIDDNNNGIIDDAAEAVQPVGDDVYLGNTPAYPESIVSSAPLIDNVDNYYAGRVITFISGNAAGQSCYIVRSKIVGQKPGSYSEGRDVRTILYVTPPENGSMPLGGSPARPGGGDRYVINGRPFNGTGFGSAFPDPAAPYGNLRMLSYMYATDPNIDGGSYSLNGKNVPIALTPNPVDYGYRQYLKTMASMVDPDEDYDAPDYQNMLIAHRQGNGRTIAPSLHRPDLVNFFLHWDDDSSRTNKLGIGAPQNGDRLRWIHIPPSIRRRIILRPDPVDHYDYTQAGVLDPQKDTDGFSPGEPFTDQNGNNQYDPGEPYTDSNSNNAYDPGDRSFANTGFDAINGPWDVDNDGDSIPDSIWVDIGLPVTTAPDGRLIKPMVAIMVIDLDGRINVNAHGSPKQYTRTKEMNDVVIQGSQYGGQLTDGDRLPPVPQNRLNPHPRSVTEERYVIGAKTFALDQQNGDTRFLPIVDPLLGSGMVPEYDSQTARWATSIELFPTQQNVNDWQALWSSLPMIYTNQSRFGSQFDNREMGPWLEPAVGQGYSVADINIGILLASQGLAPALDMSVATSRGVPQPILSDPPARTNWYRELLEGKGDGPMPLPGRYGEFHLRRRQVKVSTPANPDTAPAYYPGLGIVPRAGATYFPDDLGNENGLYSASRPTRATDDNTPGVPNVQTVLGNYRRARFNNVILGAGGTVAGDYATPPDLDSDGAVGLDYAGQPDYVRMGTPEEPIDDPTEIFLHRRYMPQQRLSGSTNSGGRGNFSYLDAQYTPGELERILRTRDQDSGDLSGRLDSMTWWYGYERHTLTSEQWDVPCPHVAPTPELAGALRDLGLSLTHPTVGDLLRARFYLTDRARVDADKSARLATVAMRSFALGNANLSPSQALLATKRRQTRLLSPDLGVGVRMDVNAPFGDGIDRNGNNVVDEPTEWMTEAVSYSDAAGNVTNLAIDGNRDGVFNTGVNPSNANLITENPRQQFAKELYCLMMLLIDENYVMPLPTAFSTAAGGGPATGVVEVLPPAPSPTAPDQLPAKYQPYTPANLEFYSRHWLTARRIAQWAVNAADFRDRDSIMSSFEFDADPFFDNDGDSLGTNGPIINIYQPFGNGTWDVDGNVDVTNSPTDDANKTWRGVVWGCEYTDLLLTETLAFHDRRTQNHEDDNGLQTHQTDSTALTGTYKLTRTNTSGMMIPTGTDSMMQQRNYDIHWDQPRMPQGSAFVELFCTGNANNPVQPAELYAFTTYQDTVYTATNQYQQTFSRPHLDLARTTGGYPIWRMPITQGRVIGGAQAASLNQTLTKNDVAARLARNPATCSLDPGDMAFSLLPWVNNVSTTNDRVTIERVVTFCPQAASLTATAGLNMTSSTSILSDPEIDVYGTLGGSPTVEPGEYVVVGPYRQNSGNNRDHITTIGRTSNTGISVISGSTTANTLRITPQPIISLNSAGFIATSPDGSDQFPYYGGNPRAALNGVVNDPNTGPYNGSRQIREPVTVACATYATLGGDNQQRLFGLNISEPTNTNRPNTYRLNNNPSSPLTIVATNFTNSGAINAGDRLYAPDPDADPDDPSPGLVDDIPWDGYMTQNVDTVLDNQSVITNTQLPRLDDHTTLRYKNVFLQRLADPLRPWHRYTNPYITVDWMPFDLTVMNAEPWSEEAEVLEHLRDPGNIRPRKSASSNSGTATQNDPAFLPTGSLASVRVRFGSRQRGAPRYPYKGNFSYCNLWAQPNYLTPYNPGTSNDPGDPGGPPADMDTRPPLTMRVSDDSNVNSLYGMQPYDYITPDDTTNPPTNVFNCRWQDPLVHTLGYLNESYHYRRRFTYGVATQIPAAVGERYDPTHRVAQPTIRPQSRTQPTDSVEYAWLTEADFVNPNDNPATQPRQYLKYIGAPWRPFNWLTWNNRPYASAAELMLVPCSSPGRLLYEFDMRRTALPADQGGSTTSKVPWEETRSANHYLPSVAASTVPGYVHRSPYGHLLNFFESSTAASASNPPEANLVNGAYFASNFYRIFEFVHVPSRFSGTQHAHANGTINGAQATYAPNVPEAHAWPFIAPFNAYPNFREPGRVNINTMPHYGNDNGDDVGVVWRSVTNNFFPTRRYIRNAPGRFRIHDDDQSSSAYPFRAYTVDGNYARAMNVLAGGANNFDSVPWNPNMDNRGSYHNLIATTRSDKPGYDPRGPNGVAGSGDSDGALYYRNLEGQHDPGRPALISNPFRSYMEGYTTLPFLNTPQQADNLVFSGASGTGQALPLLGVDATLLRRRDMTWQPFNLVPRNGNPAVTEDQFLSTRNGNQHIDPAFDPLFALNFPRPYTAGSYDSNGGGRAFSGYTGNMLYRWGIPNSNNPGVGTVSGVPSGAQNTMRTGAQSQYYDNFHTRDTDYRNTDRNPFFRYQLYNKLSNVVTTRSNCYAIWVTLGYFEVEKVKIEGTLARRLPSQVSGGFSGGDLPDSHRYPSGFRILREMGADTGEVKRHKAFALFDRTIPVGFVRGENMNVDRAFLTRRILY